MGLVNDVKLVARNCFDKMLPDNEDGMFADLKEAINSKLMELNQKQGLYSINRQYNYPGEEVINETITLLSDLSKIRDINDFFEKFECVFNKNIKRRHFYEWKIYLYVRGKRQPFT